MVSTYASGSSAAPFRKSLTPLPLTPSPIEFFNITAIPPPPLFSPAVGMSSPLSTSSTHAHCFIFVVCNPDRMITYIMLSSDGLYIQCTLRDTVVILSLPLFSQRILSVVLSVHARAPLVAALF